MRNKIGNIIQIYYLISILFYIHCEYEIKINLGRSGMNQILSSEFSKIPDKIYINGNEAKDVVKNIKIESKNDIIVLKWKNKIDTCENMFKGCKNITKIDLTNFNTSNVKSMSYMFYGCSSLSSLILTNLITTSVLNMEYMFSSCSSLVSINLQDFDTSKVTNMNRMFSSCSKLKSLDVSSFDTKNVKSMSYMFSTSGLASFEFKDKNIEKLQTMSYMFLSCPSLNSITISNLIGVNFINIQHMFHGCSKLQSFDFSNFDTSHAKNASYMFYHCTSLKSIDLTDFKTDSIESMEYMFAYSGLNAIEILNDKSFPRLITMGYMFHECSSLNSVEINLNAEILQKMDHMFQGCTSLEHFSLSKLNSHDVIDMSYFFEGCSSLNSIKFDNINNIKINNMEYMLSNCISLEEFDLSKFDISQVKNMRGMFKNTKFESFDFNNNFNISNVKTMAYMFSNCSNLVSINLNNNQGIQIKSMEFMFQNCISLSNIDLSNFETSNVLNMAFMFSGCTSLNSLKFVPENTLSVENMEYMFQDCSSLTEFEIKGFDTKNVKNMNYMFFNSGLKSFNFSLYDFSNAENMAYMFSNCKSLNSINFENYKPTQIINMEYMFSECTILENFEFLNFDISKVENMNNMFQSCGKLKSIYFKNFNSPALKNMIGMFQDCVSLNTFELTNYNAPNVLYVDSMLMNCISLVSLNFQSSHITNMSNLSYNCHALEFLCLDNFNTKNTLNMLGLFNNCTAIKNLDLNNFNTGKVTDMSYMFYNCKNLESLNIENFNTKNVRNIEYMFTDCISLNSLNLNNFVTNNVERMGYMFSGCESLSFLDISNFEVTKVNYTQNMFYNCKNLTSLNTSNFGNSIARNMQSMFENCYLLKSLDLSNFNSPNVENTSFMFKNCYSLKTLYLSEFTTNLDKDMSSMFENCFSLPSLNLSKFDSSSVTNMKNMFYNCSQLTILDLSNFKGNEVENLNSMFYYCSSLIILNLSNFNTPKLDNISHMLDGCSKLKYVNLSKLNYQNPVDNNMNIFKGIPDNFIICLSSNSISLSKLINAKPNWSVNCSKDICTHYHYYDDLEEIFFTDSDNCPHDYKNLIFEQKECVTNCSEYINYQYEFRNRCYNSCPKNINFDLAISDDNIYKCEIICTKEYPFEIISQQDCKKNCDILSLYHGDCVLNYQGENIENIMLYNILDNINTDNNLKQYIDNNENIEFNVGKLSFVITNTKFLNNKNNIDQLDKCENSLKKQYLITSEPLYLFIVNIFNEEMQTNKTIFEIYYPNQKSLLTKLDLSKCQSIIHNIIINCSTYSIESIQEDSCIKCKTGYYPIYDNVSGYDPPFKKCYTNLEEYFLSNYKAYKRCYHSCQSCGVEGDELHHNCKECKFDYFFEMTFPNSNYINCYESCYNYTYDIYKNKFICFDYPQCLKPNEKYIPLRESCTIDCKNDEKYKYEFKKVCYEKCPENSEKSNKNEYYCNIKCPKELPYENIQFQECIQNCTLVEMLKNICRLNYKDSNKTLRIKLNLKIIQEILNGELGPLISEILEENNTFIVTDENDAHFISTINAQFNKVEFSAIDFGECEKLLRNYSNICENEKLIMYKIEHSVQGFNIPIIEYVLFTQDGKQMLNLSLCEDMQIQYNIPVNINEKDENKYNPESDYYNDECNNYKSEDGLDLTINERKNIYNEKNMSLCEKGCTYKIYNSQTQQAECFCNIKSDMDYSEDNIDQSLLLNQIDVGKSDSNLNFKITQCANIITSPEQLKSNSGFFLLLIILAIFLIVFILYCSKGKRMLEQKIDDIIYKKFEKGKKHKNDKKKVINKRKRFRHKMSKKYSMAKIVPSSKNNKFYINSKNKLNLLKKEGKHNLELDHSTHYVKTEKNNQQDEIPDKDNDYELNSLSYKKAKSYDKRSCCQYYTSMLKYKQMFMFTFCSFNDYNSGIIKKFIFFLSFAVHYTVNALFFTENTFHQIYKDGGSFNFRYQLPKILFSAIISTVALRIILETLVLTDRNILQVKYQKTYNKACTMKDKILKYINLKFAIFFVLNFILLILFWYYVTIFNALFAGSQIYHIETTAISFGISLFYPVFWNIIPSIFRMFSLNSKKSQRKYIYFLSKILQVI